MTEINEVLEIELDKQFPKGDKARGRALVLFAIAQNEIDEKRKEILIDVKILIDRLTIKVDNWNHVNADVLKHYIEEELEK